MACVSELPALFAILLTVLFAIYMVYYSWRMFSGKRLDK